MGETKDSASEDFYLLKYKNSLTKSDTGGIFFQMKGNYR